jgi:hypothetical protein
MKVTIDNNKYRKMFFAITKYLQTGNLEEVKPYSFNKEQFDIIKKMSSSITSEDIDIKKFTKDVLSLCNLGRLDMVDELIKSNGIETLENLSDIHSINNQDGEAECAWYLIKLGVHYSSVIDFTDMIYLPNILNLKSETYDFVLIDECQDLSVCQRLLMLKAMKPETGRFIAVGDPHQCQPYGTKVLMFGGIEKDIEDVKVGDRVVTYDRKSSSFRDTKQLRYEKYFDVIEKIHHREINENIVEIVSGGKNSKYTKNHICYMKFKNKEKRWCVYLMKKDNKFKVGVCNLWSNFSQGNSGFNSRSRQEKGDFLWILEIFNNKKDAYIKEQIVSYRYGIPQLVFRNSGNILMISQEEIDFIYNEIPDLENRVIKCLNDHNKLYECPFYDKSKQGRTSSVYLFENYACNIFPDEMVMGIYDEINKSLNRKNNYETLIKWCDIEEMNIIPFSGKVVSLQVSNKQNYVADGILTHNCIYGFAGADVESYKKLCELPNTKQLPLSITYRCAEPIVKMVKHINSDIKSHAKNKDGIIHQEFSYKEIQDGDMVLCRQTFPVVVLCIRLLSEGKRAYIVGSDIGLSLITLIKDCERKTEEFNMLNVFTRLYHEKNKMIDKVATNNHISREEAMEDSHVVTYNEKIKVIEVLAGDTTDPLVVIKKIETIFSDEKKVGIKLSNIHKSKGLESERVFIIHRELMPSKYAETERQLQQERNLIYVAYTRAKKTLGFVNDFDAWEKHKTFENVVKAPKESKHIGGIGTKMSLNLKVSGVRDINGTYGSTVVYDLVDKDGNVFSKFGKIDSIHLSDNDDNDDVMVGSNVEFKAIIKEHSEFRGVKITKLGKISLY